MYVSRTELIDVAEQVKRRVDPTLTVVFGVDASGTLVTNDYRGSASYFTYGGFPFILTAKHVLRRPPTPEYLMHGKGEQSIFPLRDDWVGSPDQELDLALMGCFQGALDETGIRPLPFETLLPSSFDHPGAFYYCNGYPEANAVSLPFLDEYSIRGNAILGKAAELPPAFDPQKHFAIEYPSQIRPHGMSGAPIWNLRIHCVDRLEVWSPELAAFAGVVQRWLPEEGILVATRVEQIRDFVPGALIHMRNKYNWIDGDGSGEAGANETTPHKL